MKQAYWVKAALAFVLLGAGTAKAEASRQGTSAADTSPLVTEGIIAAPVGEVWEVFSTADGYKKLGVAKAMLDFRPGGLLLTSYDPKAKLGDDKTIQTEIVAYEPERLVVTRIHQPPKGFPFMKAYKHVWTVISLTDLGDGRTNLRITMVGYEADEESRRMRAFFASGNDWVLKKLQSQFEPAMAPKRAAHAESPLGEVEVTRLVNGPRQDVWNSFTTAEGWKQFFGVEAKIGRVPGDPFEMYFSRAGEMRGSEGCRILSTVPGEMISFQWNAPADLPVARANPTWVVVTLESPSPGVTRVRLRQFGFAEQAAAHPAEVKQFEEARAHFVTGWNLILDQLAKNYEKKR
jgi:uncharacterized protein YndB with AHSA1/START domain